MKRKSEEVGTLFVLGMVSTVAQVIIIRNLLQTALGNELILGLFIGIYTLMSGTGSLLSRVLKSGSLQKLASFIPLFLIVVIVLSLIPAHLMGLMSGEALNLWQTLLITVMTLGLLGLALGILYGAALEAVRTQWGRVSPGYLFEAVGSGIGGAVFTYLLASTLYSVQTMALLIALMGSWTAYRYRSKFVAFPLLIAILMFWKGESIEKWATSLELRGYKIVEIVNSRYGKIVTADRGGETTVFHNGNIFVTWPNPDFEHVEALSHTPLLAAGGMRKVLLVGSGPDMIPEILKHIAVKGLIYTQPDPAILNIVKKYGILPHDNRLKLVPRDARAFLTETQDTFDVVILDLPSPSNISLNRYYTVQFWELLKKHLSPDGAVGFTLPWSVSYIPPELELMNVSVYRSLKSQFSSVVFMSDGENLVIASDNAISPKIIADRMETNPISTRIFSPEYIAYRFARIPIMTLSAPPDDDWHPITVLYALTYWSTAFSPSIKKLIMGAESINFWWLSSALLLLVLLAFIGHKGFKHRVNITVFTTGFMAMAFDVIPMMVFQIKFGYIYETLGMIVALFHVGLAIGSFLSDRVALSRRTLIISDLLMLLVTAAMFVLPMLSQAGIYAYAILGGAAVGFQFPIVAGNVKEHAGKIYGFDLTGGAFAALSITPFMLPVLGFYQTVAFLLLIKASSVLLLSTSL